MGRRKEAVGADEGKVKAWEEDRGALEEFSLNKSFWLRRRWQVHWVREKTNRLRVEGWVN